MENVFAPYECQFSEEQRRKLIARSIKEFRTLNGYSQKEVAALLAISPQAYNNYEKGRNTIPAEILVRLSFLYDESLDAIMRRNWFQNSADETRNTLDKYKRELAEMEEDAKSGKLSKSELIAFKSLQKMVDQLLQLTEDPAVQQVLDLTSEE